MAYAFLYMRRGRNLPYSIIIRKLLRKPERDRDTKHGWTGKRIEHDAEDRDG